MKYPVRLTAVVAALLPVLHACGGNDDMPPSGTPTPTATTLSGVAAAGAELARASITVCDATGASKTATTAEDGSYTLDVSDLTAPLLVTATSGPLQYAALLASTRAGTNIANVSPLTDAVASDVATTDMELKGTVQLSAQCNPSKATAASIRAKTTAWRALIIDALNEAGVADAATFDPVTTPMTANGAGADKVLDEIRHSREGYSSSAATELGATLLYDRNMQEIRPSNPLDPSLRAWSSYSRRIFIAGDSTASNYPKEVSPRMGWGQVFDRMLKGDADVKVVNLAQSGRSSRSFIAEGWFDMLAREIKAGDYLLIQFGHNDEKCDPTGSTDWIHRCTYPNDGSSALPTENAKFPAGKDEYSFQRSLEKYVDLARARGATPVLITPVTRINQDKTVTDYVEGKFPITASTHITTKGDIPGNYAQTVIDTASANDVALVDLDAMSIAFMNKKGVGTGGADAKGGWRDDHLAVSDFTTYPYYSGPTTTGHYLNADRTHFQETGAVEVAKMAVQGIKADAARLSGLIDLLQ